MKKVILVSASVILVLAVGFIISWFGVRHTVLSNPTKSLGGDWKCGLRDVVFLQYTRSVDRRLASLLRDYVYRYDANNQYLPSLSSSDLLYIRNFFFAFRGYAFEKGELLDYFGRFLWYRPSSSVSGGTDALSDREREIVTTILLAESGELDQSTGSFRPGEVTKWEITDFIPAESDCVLLMFPRAITVSLRDSDLMRAYTEITKTDPFSYSENVLSNFGLSLQSITEATVFLVSNENGSPPSVGYILRYSSIDADPFSVFASKPDFAREVRGQAIEYHVDRNGYAMFHRDPWLVFGTDERAMASLDGSLARGSNILTNREVGRYVSARKQLPLCFFVLNPRNLFAVMPAAVAASQQIFTELHLNKGIDFLISLDYPSGRAMTDTLSRIATSRKMSLPLADSVVQGLSFQFQVFDMVGLLQSEGNLDISIRPTRISIRFRDEL